MTANDAETAKTLNQPYPEGTILLNVSARNHAHNFWGLLFSWKKYDTDTGWRVFITHGMVQPESGPAHEALMYARVRPGVPWEIQTINIPEEVLNFDRGMAARLIANLTARPWEA